MLRLVFRFALGRILTKYPNAKGVFLKGSRVNLTAAQYQKRLIDNPLKESDFDIVVTFDEPRYLTGIDFRDEIKLFRSIFCAKLDVFPVNLGVFPQKSTRCRVLPITSKTTQMLAPDSLKPSDQLLKDFANGYIR